MLFLADQRNTQCNCKTGEANTRTSLVTSSVCDIIKVHFYTCNGFHAFIFGWFKRSLNQSIGSLSCNQHFALLRRDERSEILGNASDHWGMVTYNFFRNFFFRSLIRARTGSFANVLEALCPISIKLGQIFCCQKIGHRP